MMKRKMIHMVYIIQKMKKRKVRKKIVMMILLGLDLLMKMTMEMKGIMEQVIIDF